ncbi:cation-translocating P-type ATPase [Hydrogenophaga sp. PAMC20947]|uniref:cation-translocating P-type ATPase n=1 Tax=Hydrogenophaga sp. PAMC20947 TaxID=2565558 RepID=UPI00109DE6CC|nr:cation-translocating P-type ATPase [Hydrogenophaga sp. PAMC20947]QCB47823.1 cation-translocating P-type ATPase [Hydrogenophaga sp. PAMC20947]
MNQDPPEGLDPATAAQRLRDEGPNELGVSQRRTVLDMAWDVVREPMFLLLMGAGTIYLAMGDAHEAMILLGFVVIIMAITVLQERRTDNALEALRDLSSPRALVLRGGETLRIPGREVVRDDVLLLAEGDRVPADGLLLQAHELATDESMLTGESVAVAKQLPDGQVFAGTMVVSGQGMVRVTATGRETELGRIGQSLQAIELQASPLREEMARLTRRLVVIGVALCVLLAALFWWLRGGWLEAVLAGITLAMGILPQELPVIMIVFLALAARRLAVQQVLTRRLNAIETLGQTTVLCVDKTGTLTQNRMAVAALCVADQTLDTQQLLSNSLPEAFHELIEYAVLASEIEPHDPMEQAFHRLAGAHLEITEHLHPQWTLAREYELSPELLAMSHLWRDGKNAHDVVAAKGAPEAVIDLCHLPEAQREQIAASAAAMADRGLRVLGVAKARHRAASGWPDIQHDFDFEWVGLVGLADPLRPEVPEVVAQCQRAGIRVVMITGDHPRTAGAIAVQAGIQTEGVVTGDEIAAMDAPSLAAHVARTNVFARVKPQQKLALVEALKAQGEVVAMTGDGVNDAPALKAAHIGIAMGQRGTDVAREAASLVLLQDDFTSIVRAIHRGRRTFANLRQAMVYTLAVHIPIIGLALLPVLLGLPLVLAPLHIAFLELVIDPACSLVFEAEEGDADLMDRPPRRTSEPLLSAAHVALSLLQGGGVTAVVVGLYVWVLAQGAATSLASTAAFVVLVVGNAALILPSRSSRTGWGTLWSGMTAVSGWVLGGTALALLAITSVPVLAGPFGFEPLGPAQWLLALALGAGLLLPFQANKWLLRRR